MSTQIRVSIIGSTSSQLHEPALAYGLDHLSSLCSYIKLSYLSRFVLLFYNRIPFYQHGLLDFALLPVFALATTYIFFILLICRPTLVLFYQPHWFPGYAIRLLSRFFHMACYHNDNPFSSLQQKRHPLFIKYTKNVRHWGSGFYYRDSNRYDYQSQGLHHLSPLYAWYDPRTDLKSPIDSHDHEILYCGHFEADSRVQYLNAILREFPSKLSIFGDPASWDSARDVLFGYEHDFRKIRSLAKSEYIKTVNSSKITLAFFSTWNNDNYTRRVFEIPAAGSALFAYRTSFLESIFDDGINAVLFSSVDELIDKLSFYLSRPDALSSIRFRGHVYMRSSGHDLVSRCRQIIRHAELYA